MNNMERDKILLNEGFTPKEISVIRQHAEKDGYPYPWLLGQLKKRFYATCVLMIIIITGGIYTWSTGVKEDIVSYSAMMVIAAVIFYVFTPLKPAYKAFRFLRKHPHF